MAIKLIQGQFEKNNHIHYEYDVDSVPLGEGGMGVVYLGYRVDEKSGLRTEVAIKKLHNDLPEEIYARAEREASIQLRHDNLVEMLGLISVFEANRLGEPVYFHYVISEFLHGVELSDLLEGKFENKRSEENEFARKLYLNYQKDKEKISIYIIKNVLSGVLALHDKGYIHRDIDPSNIMVTTDGHIKLIDFGIAKNLRTLESKDKLMTAAGQFIGKAEYASPELVLGDVKNQNYTTDIYALGILFYKMLVGKLPFNGSQYEILQCQLKRKVPVRNIKNTALKKIVKKSTEKIQSNRYSSIAEFRVAIDNAENYEPSFYNTYGKYVILLLVVGSIITLGCYFYCNRQSNANLNQNSIIVQKQLTQHEIFENAIVLLDSSNRDSVKSGFNTMKDLADKGFDAAKIELGLTFYSIKSKKEIRSKLLLQRRSLLELEENNINELNKCLEYFLSVNNKDIITPEVYYIWGAALLDLSNKNKEGQILCLEKFELALKQLGADKEVLHGYDTIDLKTRLEKNISKLKEVLMK